MVVLIVVFFFFFFFFVLVLNICVVCNLCGFSYFSLVWVTEWPPSGKYLLTQLTICFLCIST